LLLLLTTAAALRLVEWLALAELFLRRGDQAKIMLSMLVIIFGGDRIARGLRIARKLDIFLGDMIGRAADFHLGAIGFIDPRQRIMTLAVASAHALVLSVSHGFPARRPFNFDGARRRMVDQNPSFSDQGFKRQRRNDEADMPILTYSLRDPTAPLFTIRRAPN
jgi:hypothetical protein